LDESQSERDGRIVPRLKRLLGLHKPPKEIQQLLDESEQRGLIDEEQGEMIEGIFDLKQTVAREIMIPRTHIVAVSHLAGKDEILRTLIDSGHSRIPVYKENVDHIIGILNARDLLPLWLSEQQEIDLAHVAREPFFVPETKPIKDLLNELRSKRSHMAVIVDEYGGTAGVVTMEDIVEEIVGEIQDEHDAEEALFIPQQDVCVLVSARAPLDEFEEYFRVTLPRSGYDTLGGFIIHLLGRVPAVGEELVHEGLWMKIHSGDRKRIIRVLVGPAAAQPEQSCQIPSEETR
jgi:magnesium and cobalt transporter